MDARHLILTCMMPPETFATPVESRPACVNAAEQEAADRFVKNLRFLGRVSSCLTLLDQVG